MDDTTYDRFVAKVEFPPDPDGCWIWVGANAGRDRQYGVIWDTTRRGYVRAHRWSYEFFVGPIGDGLTIDHICQVKSCVKPEHLQVVTVAENNQLRYDRLTDEERETCRRGHANMAWYGVKRRQRMCVTCKNERRRVT